MPKIVSPQERAREKRLGIENYAEGLLREVSEDSINTLVNVDKANFFISKDRLKGKEFLSDRIAVWEKAYPDVCFELDKTALKDPNKHTLEVSLTLNWASSQRIPDPQRVKFLEGVIQAVKTRIQKAKTNNPEITIFKTVLVKSAPSLLECSMLNKHLKNIPDVERQWLSVERNKDGTYFVQFVALFKGYFADTNKTLEGWQGNIPANEYVSPVAIEDTLGKEDTFDSVSSTSKENQLAYLTFSFAVVDKVTSLIKQAKDLKISKEDLTVLVSQAVNLGYENNGQ